MALSQPQAPSTGQIEEGAVGFSVTNLDGDVVSWRFFHLAELTGGRPAIMIASPSDERFITDHSLKGAIATRPIHVRAKVWAAQAVEGVTASLAGSTQTMINLPGTRLWECVFDHSALPDGLYSLTVTAGAAEDTVRIVLDRSADHPPSRAARDQDNALPAWPEHGLPGTQMGPNKNGRKW